MAQKLDLSGGTNNSTTLYTAPNGTTVALTSPYLSSTYSTDKGFDNNTGTTTIGQLYASQTFTITPPQATFINKLRFLYNLDAYSQTYTVYKDVSGGWVLVGSVVANTGTGYVEVQVNATTSRIRVDAVHSNQGSGGAGGATELGVWVGTPKFLFQDGTNIKYYSAGAWHIAGTSPATESMFTTNGMADLTNITTTVLNGLDTTASTLLLYTTDTSWVGPATRITAVPPNKLVRALSSIDLSNYQRMRAATLTANQTGLGVVRTIVSPDDGVTWNTWDTTTLTWISVDSSNLTSVKTIGMSPSTLNARVVTDWDSLLGMPLNNLKFSFYLEQTATTDVANTDLLTLTVDFLGSWDKGLHVTDFKYGYPSNTSLQVKLYSSGDYKVNY